MSIGLSECREKCERGLTEKYKMKFEGTEQRNRFLYGKNYSRMKGKCVKCKNFDPKKSKSVDGSHCKLPADKHCLE